MKKFKESKETFMQKNYITCEHCKYNNERSRFLKYGVCLNCGKVLDEKTYFKIKMMEKIHARKRRQ